jgi:hypothetical protein
VDDIGLPAHEDTVEDIKLPAHLARFRDPSFKDLFNQARPAWFTANDAETPEAPTVSRLRASLKVHKDELARREAVASDLEPKSGIVDRDAYEGAALDALMYEREEVEPLEGQLAVAETAAREGRAVERSTILLALSDAALKSTASGDLGPIRALLEALATGDTIVVMPPAPRRKRRGPHRPKFDRGGECPRPMMLLVGHSQACAEATGTEPFDGCPKCDEIMAT